MPEDPLLLEARAAIGRRDWVSARDRFRAARRAGPLSADDTYALSDAAWWLGHVDESMSVTEEAYHLFLASDRPEDAAVAAFLIAYLESLRGNDSAASGWGARAVRHLEGLPESAAHGFLGWGECESALASGDHEVALERALFAGAVGVRFDDPNLRALGILGEGRVLVRQGRVADGMALLDEAMLAAMSPDLNPTWAGNIYCHLMLACHELSDHRRSAEWTRATKAWCESMPGSGPYLGICRVHRAQILALQGEWDEAESEVRRVCEELADFHVSMVAEAHYELGEVRRRRGQFAGAEESYREAHQRGRDPQPGLALLRLALGHPEAAAAALDAALAAQRDRLARVPHLAARVEVALALKDLQCADRACEELEATAAVYGSSGLQAIAAHVRGATLLASGQASDALPVLRRAFHCWHQLPAPYEAARVRELIADAAEILDDHETASLERDAAKAVLAALRREAAPPGRSAPAGLTPRELEVLLLAAEGRSNGDIADVLVLSIRTVERHLATVYSKLGLAGRNSRAAAVSFALRERLQDHSPRSRTELT